MPLLIDTDAFWKLSVCGLFDDAVEALGYAVAECMCLPALPHMLRRGRLAKELGKKRCANVLEMARRVPTAPAGDAPWLTAMAPVESIDPGEAQLFAVATAEGYRVLTGDKRAIVAIGQVPGLSEALAGKVICLEAALIRLCDSIGLSVVKAKIGPVLDLDAGLQICFSDTDALAGLRSYRADLEREAGAGLLAP